MGKHIYCEKPLTHTVYESRLLTKLADKYNIATQMGNQGASGAGVRKICEWIWNGEIGEITKVEAFTDRPIWPQGLSRPDKAERVPKTLNWDLFSVLLSTVIIILFILLGTGEVGGILVQVH